MKRRRIAVGLAMIAAVAMVVALLAGDQGIVTLYRGWRQMRELNTELEASRKTIDSLKLEIDRLISDTGYIERIARERYGMAREKEKMYKFIEEK